MSEIKTDGARITRGQWLAMLAAVLGWMFDGFELGLHPLVAKPALKQLLDKDIRAGLDAQLKADPAGPMHDAVAGAVASTEGTVYNPVTNALRPFEKSKTKDAYVNAVEGPITSWNSYSTAMFLFGAAAGGLVFGWLGDRVGRTRAMVWSVLTYAIFTGVGGFAQEAWQLAGLRFIAALGMGGEWSLGVALVMEIWPARFRPYLAGFIGAAANVGFLAIACLSLGLSAAGKTPDDNWRLLMFCGVAPAFLTFFIQVFVPESDKWKAAKAADKAAAATGAASGPPGVQTSILATLFSAGLRRRTLVAIGLSSVALLATWGAVQWMPLWAATLAEKTLGYKDPNAGAYVQVWSAVGACIGTVGAALFAGRFGRRITYVLLCVLSMAATGWLFRTEQVYGNVFLFYVFLVGLTTAAFYGWIPLYLPELFPTRVRATGQGLAYNSGRIFSAIGNLTLTGPLLAYYDNDYAPAMAAVTLIYIVGIGLIWFGPETKGKPLPE